MKQLNVPLLLVLKWRFRISITEAWAQLLTVKLKVRPKSHTYALFYDIL